MLKQRVLVGFDIVEQNTEGEKLRVLGRVKGEPDADLLLAMRGLSGHMSPCPCSAPDVACTRMLCESCECAK
jgi:hypothetical protein